jgi:LuxR family transcriptional regulator, maltose regulon positive regulatory protein
LVTRARLFSRLAEGAAGPLTLVAATAGFGKTTVLTDWIHASGDRTHVAWLSLDKDDNDPVLFVSYFVSALEMIEPGIGRAALSLLGSLKTPTPKDLMIQLLNEIAVLPGSLVLVLDDYHVIEDPDIDAALTYVVDHLPEQLRLVIATRTEPRLPLARWRTQERITEIGVDDLRFSYEEAAQFLKQTMGLELDAESARALEDRTEGWIAGLQMAALSVQGHARTEGENHIAEVAKAFGGGHRYVIDYLAAEVLRQQPEEVRTFLRQTAILERLCASLCDAVTGRTDGKALLSHIEQANLFLVRLDDHRQWYRYHQLFADFLRAELPESEQATLHRKASAWYEAHGLAQEAIRHALAVQDIPATVRLIRAHADEMACRGEFPTVLAWLEALPDSTVRAHSDLSGFKAWLLYLRARIDEAEVYSALAHSVERHDASGVHRGTLLTFRAFLAINRCDPKQAVSLAQEALDQLGDTQSFFRTCALSLLGHAQRFSGDRKAAIETLQRTVELGQKLGNHLIVLDALGSLALLLYTQGQLREAMLLCQQAVGRHVDARGKPLPATGLVYVPLGVLYYEINDLESARNCLTTGIALCQQLGMAYYTLLGQRSLARVQHVRGERDAAWNTLAAARQLAQKAETPRHQRLVDAVTAELQLREGNVAAAARTLGETHGVADSASKFERLTYARLFLAQGQPRMAESVLGPVEETARKEERAGSLIAIHVLQALCKRALGNRAAALESLEHALSLAATPGYRRVFLDEGPAVSALLGQLRHVAPAFVNSLLEAFPHAKEAAPAAATLPVPLSKTQLEILHLLDFGLSNQEIAAKLRITVGTTKWHMNQMFGKLQAHSRTEVVAKARKLGLL